MDRKTKRYDVEDLLLAVTAVKAKRLTFRQAQEQYGVPRSVIFNRIKGCHTSVDKIGAGHPTVLSAQAEKDLEECIIARARYAYPCGKQELLTIVQQYIKANLLPTPFKNDSKPGDDWYQGFMNRHPRLSLKNAEALQKVRKNARDPFCVYDFVMRFAL